MPSHATAHNTSRSYEYPSSQHVNAFTVQPDYRLARSNGLKIHHVKDMIKNETVSIQVSAPGWIISTAISLIKFMGKSTGKKVDIKFLE